MVEGAGRGGHGTSHAQKELILINIASSRARVRTCALFAVAAVPAGRGMLYASTAGSVSTWRTDLR